MLKLKSRSDMDRIKESGAILMDTLLEVKEMVAPGITTGELDMAVREILKKRGAIPAFLGYMDYPAALCTAVNYQVIHGIPGKLELKEGDIIGLDLGVNLKGFFSDACISVAVGKISEERQKLMTVTEECLYLGIAQAKPGNRINDIGKAVFDHARSHGYELVRDFCGHGVGFSIHEDPQVPNYVNKGRNPRLKPGMVICIEPMVNVGTYAVKVLDDDWTVETADKSDSCHFEHTVAITDDGYEILTLPS